MRIFIVIIMFLIISALLIISNNNLIMLEPKNLMTFSELYLNWADNLYKNMQIITGEAIKLNWFPELS